MRCVLFSTSLVLGCAATILAATPESPSGVRLTELGDRVRVELNGRLFTEYYFANVPRPFCYPLIGPGGKPMTRNYPMTTAAGEAHDHPHHRSLWFTHGQVNGQDFWSEGKGHGNVVHAGFAEIRSGADAGSLRARNQWIAESGKVICTDDRVLRFYAPGKQDERMIDWEITVHASHGDLVFGDTKEGSMAVRVAETMRLKGEVGRGHIVNSEGIRDDKTWGKRARWCDYYGPVEQAILGIAIFDHPTNPRHPTWWHVRDYGLFAANPFGRHDFESLNDKAAGDLKVAAGKSVTFKYRLYLHKGNETEARVESHYREYVK